MNYLSKKLTAYILRKGLISQENTDAYEYGFLYLLEVLVSLFCSIIIAVFLNAEVECLLFFLFLSRFALIPVVSIQTTIFPA